MKSKLSLPGRGHGWKKRGEVGHIKNKNDIYFTLVVQLTCLTMRALILCLATGMSQGPYLAPFFGTNFGLWTSLVIIAHTNHMID
jgi:hypothetical protein